MSKIAVVLYIWFSCRHKASGKANKSSSQTNLFNVKHKMCIIHWQVCYFVCTFWKQQQVKFLVIPIISNIGWYPFITIAHVWLPVESGHWTSPVFSFSHHLQYQFQALREELVFSGEWENAVRAVCWKKHRERDGKWRAGLPFHRGHHTNPPQFNVLETTRLTCTPLRSIWHAVQLLL